MLVLFHSGNGALTMMQHRIDTAWTAQEVNSFKTRLNAQGFKVIDFGAQGACSEIDGMQCWRATRTDGGDTYHVSYNERLFPDV
jgi:hypothetical protein